MKFDRPRAAVRLPRLPNVPQSHLCEILSKRYRMANFLAPVSIRFDSDPGYVVAITVAVGARDRQTGRPLEFLTRDVYPGLEDLTLDEIDRLVFERVFEAIRHEVMEAFHADGRRIFDPHVGEPGYVPEHAPPEAPPRYRGAPGTFRPALDRGPIDFRRAVEEPSSP